MRRLASHPWFAPSMLKQTAYFGGVFATKYFQPLPKSNPMEFPSALTGILVLVTRGKPLAPTPAVASGAMTPLSAPNSSSSLANLCAKESPRAVQTPELQVTRRTVPPSQPESTNALASCFAVYCSVPIATIFVFPCAMRVASRTPLDSGVQMT